MDQDDTSDYTNVDSSQLVRVENKIFDIIQGFVPTLIWLIDVTVILKPFFVFTIIRNEMKGTKIGGRYLDLTTTDKKWDGNLEMILPCIWNTYLDITSIGLWKALGLMHYFYLYKLDQRICWGRIENQTFEGDSIVFRPNEDDEQEFVIYSAYCGHRIELIEWLVTLGGFSIIRCLLHAPIFFLIPPITDVWALKHRIKHIKYGGRGKFVSQHEYTNPNAEPINGFPSSVMLSTNISYTDYTIHHLGCFYLGVLTCLVFSFVYGFKFMRQYKDSTIHLTNKK